MGIIRKITLLLFIYQMTPSQGWADDAAAAAPPPTTTTAAPKGAVAEPKGANGEKGKPPPPPKKRYPKYHACNKCNRWYRTAFADSPITIPQPWCLSSAA